MQRNAEAQGDSPAGVAAVAAVVGHRRRHRGDRGHLPDRPRATRSSPTLPSSSGSTPSKLDAALKQALANRVDAAVDGRAADRRPQATQLKVRHRRRRGARFVGCRPSAAGIAATIGVRPPRLRRTSGRRRRYLGVTEAALRTRLRGRRRRSPRSHRPKGKSAAGLVGRARRRRRRPTSPTTVADGPADRGPAGRRSSPTWTDRIEGVVNGEARFGCRGGHGPRLRQRPAPPEAAAPDPDLDPSSPRLASPGPGAAPQSERNHADRLPKDPEMTRDRRVDERSARSAAGGVGPSPAFALPTTPRLVRQVTVSAAAPQAAATRAHATVGDDLQAQLSRPLSSHGDDVGSTRRRRRLTAGAGLGLRLRQAGARGHEPARRRRRASSVRVTLLEREDLRRDASSAPTRSTDLAVLEVDAPASALKPLALGDSSRLEVGDARGCDRQPVRARADGHERASSARCTGR